MLDKTYHDFADVEADIRAAVEPTLYKYRNWAVDIHRTLITQNQIWFAHPFKLNDPYDVRPPYNIINPGIDWVDFRKKLEIAARAQEEGYGVSEQRLQAEIEKRFKQAQDNPIGYVTKNRQAYIMDEERYNQIGVCSLCTNGLNEAMWAYYGDNHAGFAIGFDTVELARALDCRFGYVDYNDTLIDYVILGNNEIVLHKEVFQKSTKWAQEEEFRFLTAGIGKGRERAATFPKEAITEILVGLDTKDDVLKEIQDAVNVDCPGVPIYRVARQMNSFGFTKQAI